ncbi:MAG TPA: ABC transporter permease subunit [Planctomycetota bacterium]|nr:ABC transporter permease subunit [Planctomycetota bacterium]
MRSARTLAFATYGEITRRPLYYILLLSFAVAVFFSKMLTLFSFHQEMNMVREMGMATLTFWGFIIIVVTSGIVVTQELEDRTAVTLLSKPIRRSDFLLGKFLGLWLALIPGVVVLAGVLLLTLWMMAAPHLHLYDRDVAEGLKQGLSPFRTAWGAIWEQFVLRQGGIVLQGALLSIFQSAILAALSVSFSAFFPNVVAVSATTLLFILGNISSYMVASVERMESGPLTLAARGFSFAMPNFGYFNLQTYFSEGKIITVRYLAMSFAYAALFVGAVFLVSCSLFRKREVR